MEDCLICRKHQGLDAQPPGGYVYVDAHWMVCHAPVQTGPLGTLFIESVRHFLDYARMTPEESISLGEVLRRTYGALRSCIDPARIYQLSTMEGVPHYHSWIVPRRERDLDRGLKFLARDDDCTEAEAVALAEALRKEMK